MHLQHFWFHENLAHQLVISRLLGFVPQWHVAQFPEGQFPPHLLV